MGSLPKLAEPVAASRRYLAIGPGRNFWHRRGSPSGTPAGHATAIRTGVADGH
jgi:hypothetical protein